MKLSAPVYILKQRAKALSRDSGIPLARALDRIAKREGFASWSLLAARARPQLPASRLFAELRPGHLVLLAARRGQGKTLLSLELAVRALRVGGRAAFFTLEFSRTEVAEYLAAIGASLAELGARFSIDDSDDICADYVAAQLAGTPPGTLVVLDYLQMLDRKRTHPALAEQVQSLKDLARRQRLIVVCLSQIDRSFDATARPCPDAGDVRLANPLDLGLFDRLCFLERGEMRIATAG
jgi:replicative DNA helicase